MSDEYFEDPFDEYSGVRKVLCKLDEESQTFLNTMRCLTGGEHQAFIAEHGEQQHKVNRAIELNTIISDLIRVFGPMTKLVELDEWYRQGLHVTQKHMMVPSEREFHFYFVFNDETRVIVVEKNWDVGTRIAKLLFHMDNKTLSTVLDMMAPPPTWQT